MNKQEIREKVYDIIGKPDWWYKSNNWKKMHGYPMLHHQKKKKSENYNRRKFELFDYVEQIFDEAMIEHANKAFKDYAAVSDIADGGKVFQEFLTKDDKPYYIRNKGGLNV